MTEIPEHLLERSKARRAALGLLKDGETASTTTPVKAGDDADAPVAAAAPAARAAAAPAPVVVKAPEPVPHYVAAALARKKIPVWVAPVLLFLPIWMILYVGTLERPPAATTGLLAEGATTYDKCASCHGAGGGGGLGRQLNNGEVLATFPNAADHVWWVVNGSEGVGIGNPYGNPDRPGGQRIAAGAMASWASTLSAKDLLAVVYYERIRLGGSTEEAEIGLKTLSESPELPANFTQGMTAAEIAALISAAETAAGVTATPAS